MNISFNTTQGDGVLCENWYKFSITLYNTILFPITGNRYKMNGFKLLFNDQYNNNDNYLPIIQLGQIVLTNNVSF